MNNLLHHTRSALAVAVAAILLASNAAAELLGIEILDPKIEFDSGGTTTFDAGTGELNITASPTIFTDAGGATFTILPLATALLTRVSTSLDSSCGLVGGDASGDDLLISGDIDLDGDFNPEYAGVLLTGEIVAFGTPDSFSAASASFDARFAVSGGTMADGNLFTVGQEIGLTLTVENNDFASDCSQSWGGGAKGFVGDLEDIEPPKEACYEVASVYVRDGKKHHRHWGHYGKSGSKIEVRTAAGCDEGFDPTHAYISLALDGEVFEFHPGSFHQVGHKPRYRAFLGGKPRAHAVLACDKGRFAIAATRADSSQIDNSDGVDVKLTLGDWVQTENVTLRSTGHHYYRRGHRNVMTYRNDDVKSCALAAAPKTHYHKVKCRHRASGRLYTYFANRGDFTSTLVATDAESGDTSLLDTSTGSELTCGDGDSSFEVVDIEHAEEGRSCTLLSEESEDEDSEDNNY